MHLTRPETYQFQWQHVQSSPKFLPTGVPGQYEPAPFPGYTVMTPPAGEDAHNQVFYSDLETLQKQLHDHLGSELFIPLPPDTFHLTVADLIWGADYQATAQEKPNFDNQLLDCLTRTFQRIQPQDGNLLFKPVGLMLMNRAIGLCFIPADESTHQGITHLRRTLYQNPEIIALGIEPQYPYTAHITLGYLGSIPPTLEGDRLSSDLTRLNEVWQQNPQTEKRAGLTLHRAELRKFDSMVNFYRASQWPTIDWGT